MATAAEVTALDMKLTAVQTDLKADIARVESKVDDILAILRKREN
jgi:hypothetical protein